MNLETIPIESIELNEGQIPGLPQNPRTWNAKSLARLEKSIRKTPRLLELRAPIVTPHDGKYIVICGNMRVTAIKNIGKTEILCFVTPPEYSITKLKEIAIKDNTHLGRWGFDALADEWTDYDLADYGIPVYGSDETPANDAPTSEVDDRTVIEIELTPDEFSFVTSKLREHGATPEDAVLKLFGYEP